MGLLSSSFFFFFKGKSGQMELVSERIQMSVDRGKVSESVGGGSEGEKMGADT